VIKNNQIVFILGGIRSGKSKLANVLAQQRNGEDVIYIATCMPKDMELKKRVEEHKRCRPTGWITIEEPENLADVLLNLNTEGKLILIECITMFISNLLLDGIKYESIVNKIKELIKVLKTIKNDVIIVSNEVGFGGISPNKLARQFADILGIANQLIANIADEVYLVTAGIPTRIK
jgi:adenosylcobinamide kinase/adenosylcobinamide-phosphate guanylyltransferase